MFADNLKILRKTKGYTQEELASKLKVVRQTVSKWEVGDSTPDMEKLVAMSDLFDVSLDKLVMGKEDEKSQDAQKSELVATLNEKVLTDKNKKKAKSIIKTIAIIAGILLAIDAVSMIVFFAISGFPR